MKMDNQSLLSLLQQTFPTLSCAIGNQYVEMTVAPQELQALMQELKTNKALLFDFLFCQTGVDIDNKLGVVYHLRSTELGHTCVVKAFAEQRDGAQLPTVCNLWPAAQYFEREIFDLVGIDFNGHPNMKRIFLEDTFVGHPLRKDFVDPINIILK